MHIQPYADNAKKHPKKQVELIAESIKRFGMNQPIVVDEKGIIIVGHGRYAALKLLGWEVKDEWVKQLNNLTQAEINAYRLADNKLNESDWDMDLVLEELHDLADAELQKLTGFDIDLLVEKDEKEDVVPVAKKEARTKLGDVYQLGNHRVMCGDSTKHEDIEKLLDGNRGDIVFTSPPYSDMREYNGEKDLSVDNIANFINRYAPHVDVQVVNLGIQRKDGAIYPYWDGYTQVAKEAGLKMLAWNVWNRIHPRTVAQNTAFIPIAHEWIFVYGKGDTDVKKTKVSKTAGCNNSGAIRQPDGSLTYRSYKTNPLKKITSVTTTGVESSGIHPAMFPVALAEEYILAMAPQTVIDPFLGGGTTLIAAEKSNRTCYGMELDPTYVDIVVQRYVDYVDNPIVKLNNEDIEWSKTVK